MSKCAAAIMFAFSCSSFACNAYGQVADKGRYQDSSGPRTSGECANFSEWYVLKTRPIENGRTIANFEYHLKGDRRCGAWAECELVTDSDKEKEVRFRMQGHSEFCGLGSIGRPNNGTAQSEMVFKYDVK